MAESLSTVRVVLSGIGGYGGHYLAALLDREQAEAHGVELVAAADPFADRCNATADLRDRGVAVYHNSIEMLEGAEADLAVLACPIHEHCPQTLAALGGGLHVLCEKPLAPTLEDADRMAAAERECGRRVAIGYQWSFSQAVQRLKADILAGRFGRPLRMRTQVLWPRLGSYYARNDWAGHRSAPDGRWVLDSPAANATAHYLHNMLYLLGPTLQTSASLATIQAERYRAKPIESYDTAAMRILTADGVEVLFYTTHSVRHTVGPQSSFEFEEATVTYGTGPQGGEDFLVLNSDASTETMGNPNHGPHDKLWQCVEMARTGNEPICGIAAARAHTQCICGAEKCGPIVDLPRGGVRTESVDGDELIWFDGLAEALTECWKRRVLPSQQTGLDWASAGTVVDVRGL